MTDARAVAREMEAVRRLAEQIRKAMAQHEGALRAALAEGKGLWPLWDAWELGIREAISSVLTAALLEREQVVWMQAAMDLETLPHFCVGDAGMTESMIASFKENARRATPPPRAGREAQP